MLLSNIMFTLFVLHCVPFSSGPFSTSLSLSCFFSLSWYVWVWETIEKNIYNSVSYLMFSSTFFLVRMLLFAGDAVFASNHFLLWKECVLVVVFFSFYVSRLSFTLYLYPFVFRPWNDVLRSVRVCIERKYNKCHCVEWFITYIVLCQSVHVFMLCVSLPSHCRLSIEASHVCA